MAAKLRCGSLCLFMRSVSLYISISAFLPLCVSAATFVCTTCVYLSCLCMCIYLSTYCVPSQTHSKWFVIWGPCWAGCAILFLGLPSLPPAPQILLHPYDTWNVTGQDVIFGCEVFAYPMASIEWRKDGLDIQLPGDDPHISVQVGAGS